MELVMEYTDNRNHADNVEIFWLHLVMQTTPRDTFPFPKGFNDEAEHFIILKLPLENETPLGTNRNVRACRV